MAELTALILAGGLGTRLRPLIPKRPKVLAQVAGRPFLAHLLEQVEGAGMREIILCTGYLGAQVREAFGARYHNVRLIYSQESRPLGTAGALQQALPRVASEAALVMNGDSFCDIDLRTFQAWHGAHRATATLALVHEADTTRYGRVDVREDGTVTRFEEKPTAGSSGWVNAGLYLFERPFLQALREWPEGMAISLEREVLPAWVNRGLYGYQSERRFLDIGTPQAYRTAEQFFAASHLR